MDTDAENTEPAKRVIARFYALSRGWWRGKTAKTAWFLTLALAFSLIINVAIHFANNRWNRYFFDALERKDASTAIHAALIFLGLVLFAAAIGVCILLARETLQVRWREWLVHRLTEKWLAGNQFHKLIVAGQEPSNPEYRIADDTRLATEPLVDFAIGLITSIVSAGTFIIVLWQVGGGIKIGGVEIPAYMVVAAFIYAMIVSLLMIKLGHQLPREVALRNAGEARFRLHLARTRDHAAELTETNGAAHKLHELKQDFSDVAQRFMSVVRRAGNLTWITNSNGVFIPVFPLLLAAPKYFNGEFTLGEVTQLAGAFIHTQLAVGWLIDNFRALAQCYASVLRISTLDAALYQGENET